MPNAINASRAPSGLAVRIERVRYDGLALRVWRMTLDGAPTTREQGRVDTVLVHGLGVSSRYFEKVAVRLAASGPVWLLDLPGFAGVPQPDRPLGVDDYARLIRRWVRGQGLVGPLLVGHSMGSQIVVEALTDEPDLAAGAVLIGPPVNVLERSSLRQAMRLAQSSVFESSQTRRIAMSGYVHTGPRWFGRVLPRMLAYPIEERIARVTVPLLIIRGEHDSVAPRAWVERLAVTAPDARWVEVPGAAHAVIYDHRDDVVEHVLRHARR